MNIEELSELLRKYKELKEYINKEDDTFRSIKDFLYLTSDKLSELLDKARTQPKIDENTLDAIEKRFNGLRTFIEEYSKLRAKSNIQNLLKNELTRITNIDLKDIKGTVGDIK